VSDQPNTVPTAAKPSAAPKSAAGAKDTKYFWGTGRRKTAVARVRIVLGAGKVVVNEKPFEQFFALVELRTACTAPLAATEALDKFDVNVRVHGGGPSGQAGAVSLGLARALIEYDAAFEPTLRNGQYLTRDSRKVERKKYGRSGARRRFQFSKR
jgi:small subunit ribosomal protein S9